MSAEGDYSPLSAACVKALTDKLHDKRRAAANEIEKMVKEFAAVKNSAQIKKILTVLGDDFAHSKNPNVRKGGLLGLSAVAIALGQDAVDFSDSLILPMLDSFSDADGRSRYFACESLYNVIKVCHRIVLPHFAAVFQALSKLVADPEQSVKNAVELLDRMLKDILMENAAFDCDSLIPLIRDRLYTNNPFCGQFIISWVSTLVDMPHTDPVSFLPDILDGLFHLQSQPTGDVKKMCEAVTSQLLGIIMHEAERVQFEEMINIIAIHSQSADAQVQFTALAWMNEFLRMSGIRMLPFTSAILVAVFPCLAYDADNFQHIQTLSSTINSNLLLLVDSERDSQETKTEHMEGLEDDYHIDLRSVTDVLAKYISYNSKKTKEAVLNWILKLYQTLPRRMSLFLDEYFAVLLRTLCDTSDDVVLLDLTVIASISVMDPAETCQNANASYIDRFIVELLDQFKKDDDLLSLRGSFIIRKLCCLLDANDIYRKLAITVSQEENLTFASEIVEQLNTILLTSGELFRLRSQLRNVATNEESAELFRILYKTWSHNPVATIALCFLTRNYEHASRLIKIFASLEVTVNLLWDIDKLIQLIESPIFTDLRLELLDIPRNEHLIRALYSLLMIIPQSDAFESLKKRLDCLPKIRSFTSQKEEFESNSKIDSARTLDGLLDHYKMLQERHALYRINRMSKMGPKD